MIGPLLPGQSEAWCYWRKLTSTCAASYLPDLGGSLSCDGRQATSTSLWPYRKLPGRNAAQVVLQWLRSRCRCPFWRRCPCPLQGQTKMFCIFQFHRQRWQIGKSNLITPNLNYFLHVQITIGLKKIKIHCILLVWERFDGSAFFELILALYPVIWCGGPNTPRIRREPELLWILE